HLDSLQLILLHTTIAPPSTYTLSLHDALPICFGIPHELEERVRRLVGDRINAVLDLEAKHPRAEATRGCFASRSRTALIRSPTRDRKSTRLNSSHDQISYAVFCLKKKKKKDKQ